MARLPSDSFLIWLIWLMQIISVRLVATSELEFKVDSRTNNTSVDLCIQTPPETSYFKLEWTYNANSQRFNLQTVFPRPPNDRSNCLLVKTKVDKDDEDNWSLIVYVGKEMWQSLRKRLAPPIPPYTWVVNTRKLKSAVLNENDADRCVCDEEQPSSTSKTIYGTTTQSATRPPDDGHGMGEDSGVAGLLAGVCGGAAALVLLVLGIACACVLKIKKARGTGNANEQGGNLTLRERINNLCFNLQQAVTRHERHSGKEQSGAPLDRTDDYETVATPPDHTYSSLDDYKIGPSPPVHTYSSLDDYKIGASPPVHTYSSLDDYEIGASPPVHTYSSLDDYEIGAIPPNMPPNAQLNRPRTMRPNMPPNMRPNV